MIIIISLFHREMPLEYIRKFSFLDEINRIFSQISESKSDTHDLDMHTNRIFTMSLID